MTKRTKTYLAEDWTGDKDLIDKLHEWNGPESLRNIGTHIPSEYLENGTHHWDYLTIKNAICK